MKTDYAFPCYVECPECGERFDETNIEETNIEEDWRGADVVTFECPSCHRTVQSHRFG